MENEALASIRRLTDIEAIHRLKAAYCAACDADHDSDAVAALFVPDGIWATSMNDHCAGHDAIRAHFDGIRANKHIAHSTHMVTNPVIDVDGDEAIGTWSLLMMYAGPDQSRYRIIGFYCDRYVRRDGRWLFASLFADVQDYARVDGVDMLAARLAR